MLADELARSTAAGAHAVCHTPAPGATHAPSGPPRRQGPAAAALAQTETRGRRRFAHADPAKTGPFGLTRPPAATTTCKHPDIKGEKKHNLSCSGFCRAGLLRELVARPGFSPLSGGLVVFVSRKLTKMLDNSHSIYTWFCRIVKKLVVTLCSFSIWIKRLFLSQPYTHHCNKNQP